MAIVKHENGETVMCPFADRSCSDRCRAFHVFEDGTSDCMRMVDSGCIASSIAEIVEHLGKKEA